MEQNPETHLKGNDQTQCVACKTIIPDGAKICHACSSYQSPLKNKLRIFVTVVSVLVVICTLLTYIVTALPEVRKYFFGRDGIEIINFDSSSRIVIRNSGDFDVFVSHALIESDRPKLSHGIDIYKMVRAGEILVYDFEESLRKIDFPYTAYKMSDEEWQIVSSKGYNPTKSFKSNWVFFNKQNPKFKNWKDFFKGDLRFIEVKANIAFYSKQVVINHPILLYGMHVKVGGDFQKANKDIKLLKLE